MIVSTASACFIRDCSMQVRLTKDDKALLGLTQVSENTLCKGMQLKLLLVGMPDHGQAGTKKGNARQ